MYGPHVKCQFVSKAKPLISSYRTANVMQEHWANAHSAEQLSHINSLQMLEVEVHIIHKQYDTFLQEESSRKQKEKNKKMSREVQGWSSLLIVTHKFPSLSNNEDCIH